MHKISFRSVAQKRNIHPVSFVLLIPLSKESNVATFLLAPGFSNYFTFCAKAGIDDSNDQVDPIECSPAVDIYNTDIVDTWNKLPLDTPFHDTNQSIVKKMVQVSEGVRGVIDTGTNSENMAKFLCLHQRMGHVPFKKMNVMAHQNIVPKRFVKCPALVCAACTYAKLTKKAWQNKPSKGYEDTNKATTPGKKVSDDQLVLPTPGLIAQLTGRLTTKQYKYTTVYVDNYPRHGYVHTQMSSSAEETIEGKEIFKAHMRSMGVVKVKTYVANNGIFRDHKWVDTCKEKGQSLSFVGVNAHHQNGYAERHI